MKPLLLLPALAAITTCCLLWAARGASTTSAPASAPASRPGAWPDQKLIDATNATADELRKRLDSTFEIVVSPPFVVAGNQPRRTVEAHAQHSVVRPAEAMWASYFQARPDKPITILLFADDSTYRAWAKKLFNDTDVSMYGYYRDEDRTMVMNIATGGGTLVHELTHALIVYDFPRVPTWFNEGLGSLHEQCSIRDDGIVGLENWRLPDLQKAVTAGTLRPLREMVSANDFYVNHRGLNYAQARYFVMYMQQQGLLGKFYRHYREHHAKGAVAAIEAVLGRKIEDVEKDYLAWVLALSFPPRR